MIQFFNVQFFIKNLPKNITPLNDLFSIVYSLSPVFIING